MSDYEISLIEKLRSYNPTSGYSRIMREAADDIESLQAEVERLREENASLRLMLAVSYSGPLLYSDDGELQDNRVQPFIDFIRDSVQKIADKMKQRSINELTERGISNV